MNDLADVWIERRGDSHDIDPRTRVVITIRDPMQSSRHYGDMVLEWHRNSAHTLADALHRTLPIETFVALQNIMRGER